MRSDDWQKVKSIFNSVLELDESRREEYLAEACDGDSELRRKVEEMLSSYETGFLEASASDNGLGKDGDGSILAVGDRVAHFEIIKLLGSGGMGQVYLAHDDRLDRSVAIKVFSTELSGGPARLGRFIREAKSASALNHPNICTIYEIGPEHDPPYIAMEYIKGDTLAEMISSRRLNIDQKIDIAIQAGEALAEAHDAGIIHRDIKPANIIVNMRGHVKVVDFGLAKKIIASDEALTQKQLSHAGMIIGTASYMSPEQARGKELDKRTDIWSLGVVLYEMLTGKVPFSGETTGDVIAAILRSETPTLNGKGYPVSTELERVIAKTLAKEKNERYQSAHELVDNLLNVKKSLDGPALDKTLADRSHDQTTLVMDHQTADAAQTAAVTVESSAARQPARRSMIAAASIVFVLLVIGGWLYYGRPAAAPIDSLAVMPLSNQTGNPESEYLSDGITESLIGRLSQIPNLSVKARSTVFRFKGKDMSPKDIGKELGVPALLTGRVSRHDDQFSLYIELVDAATEKVIWQAEYNRPESSLTTIPGEIARDVANNLRQKLSGPDEQKIARNYTDNSAAYELYLKGRYYWDKRNEESYLVAEDAYKKAIALDPNYALAYAGLADCYLFRERSMTREVAMPKAKELALKALELDESLAEAHTTLAFVTMNYELDMAGGEKEFKRAIELKPNYAIAHQFYGALLVANGRIDEGLGEMRKAVDLEPYTATINWSLGMGLGFARRYDESIAQLQKTLQIQPNHALTENTLAGMYILAGRFDEAMVLAQRYVDSPERRELALSNLAMIYVKTGRASEARRVIKEMTGICKTECGNAPNGIARAYAVLGDKDEAFRWLNIGYDRRVFNMFFLRVDPFFDSLHDDPRFEELVRRIGLQ